jgi:hypothetical protein
MMTMFLVLKFLLCIIFIFSDGWTTNDLIYEWKSTKPVQFAGNISLPGGFKMDGYDNENCDVKTATGKALKLFFLHSIL